MNILIVIAGIALIFLGIYRENPVSNYEIFLRTNAPIFVCLCLLVFWVARLGGRQLLAQGIKACMEVAGIYSPMLVMLIPIMGVGVILAAYYQQFIVEMLRGRFGYLGTLAAAFASPVSVTLSKFVESAWSNRSIRPQLLYLLTATPLVSWNILLIRQMGLGWDIALTMYRINWIVAAWLIIPFWIWGKFFTMP